MTRKIFKQGDVYLVEFKPERVGSYGKRPVVCLHDSATIVYNHALVAPLTGLYNQSGEMKSRNDLTDIAIFKKHYPDGPITKDSIIMVHQIRLVQHWELAEYLGRLHERDIQQIKYSLILLFRLDKLLSQTVKGWSEMAGE